MSASDADLTVEEVLRFEGLPPDSLASRHAVVRWSDGTEGEALRWYADEVLVCEGDLIGKTREQLRSLLSGGIATGFSPSAAGPHRGWPTRSAAGSGYGAVARLERSERKRLARLSSMCCPSRQTYSRNVSQFCTQNSL